MKRVVILGGGGFIGGHLAKRLKQEGNQIDKQINMTNKLAME